MKYRCKLFFIMHFIYEYHSITTFLGLKKHFILDFTPKILVKQKGFLAISEI